MSAPSRFAFAFLWLFVLSFPTEQAFHVPGIGTVSRLMGILALGAGVLAATVNGRIRTGIAAQGALVAFVAWSAFTIRWSIDPSATAEKASTYIQLLGMVWLIWEFCPTRERVHTLMQAYVLGCAIAGFDTVSRYFGAHQTYYERYAGGGFDPNDLALTVALGIPLSYYLSLQNKRTAWVYRAQIVLSFAAVLLSASRTGFMASCAALSIIPLTFSYLQPRQRLGIILGAIVAVSAGLTFAPASSWKRLSTIGSEVSTGTLNNRQVIWTGGWAAFREHPIGGVGAGAFPRSIEPVLGWPAHWLIVAHNTFLSILFETGIVGAALFLLFFWLLIAGVLHLHGQERRLWIVMLAVWFIGVNTLTWEIRKPTWLLFSLALTHPFAWKLAGQVVPISASRIRTRRPLEVVLP